eukprot:scaffold13227_cov117-Isochrysis_galbana.AAC.13
MRCRPGGGRCEGPTSRDPVEPARATCPGCGSIEVRRPLTAGGAATALGGAGGGIIGMDEGIYERAEGTLGPPDARLPEGRFALAGGGAGRQLSGLGKRKA